MNARATRSFWRCFNRLPIEIQARAGDAYALWSQNPAHSSLQFKCVNEAEAVWSVRIGLRWRALGYRDKAEGADTVTWYWIGSHAEYDRLTSAR